MQESRGDDEQERGDLKRLKSECAFVSQIWKNVLKLALTPVFTHLAI